VYAENYVGGVLVAFGVPFIIMKLRLTREWATLNKDRVTPESLSNNPESLRKYASFVEMLHYIIQEETSLILSKLHSIRVELRLKFIYCYTDSDHKYAFA
jgi:hypothetical protein